MSGYPPDGGSCPAAPEKRQARKWACMASTPGALVRQSVKNANRREQTQLACQVGLQAEISRAHRNEQTWPEHKQCLQSRHQRGRQSRHSQLGRCASALGRRYLVSRRAAAVAAWRLNEIEVHAARCARASARLQPDKRTVRNAGGLAFYVGVASLAPLRMYCMSLLAHFWATHVPVHCMFLAEWTQVCQQKIGFQVGTTRC